MDICQPKIINPGLEIVVGSPVAILSSKGIPVTRVEEDSCRESMLSWPVASSYEQSASQSIYNARTF